MGKSLKEYLNPNNGTKRILFLNGGCIKGTVTLAYLKKIGTTLNKQENNSNLLLCVYLKLSFNLNLHSDSINRMDYQ
jgi:hypothetical protein